MRRRFIRLEFALAFFLPLSYVSISQAQRTADQNSESESTEAAGGHDLSGTWIWEKGVNLGPISSDLSMTVWGKAKFDSYKPSFGPRAVAPSIGNDPLGDCDPVGIPRILSETFYGVTEIQFVPSMGRMLQLITWNHVWRDIWMDGRGLPKDPDPRWLGYSIGKWEGNEFVIESIGFDERTWLDTLGDPHSDQMRLEERYRRVNHNSLQLSIKIIDPKAYTRPIETEVIYKLSQDPKAVIEEVFCVPSVERAFNNEVRDPAGGTEPQK